MNPKVSVVTCSYNRPALLRKAIESMRAQTDPDWEHLIYDDHSTDPGVDEVLRWALEDDRVRVWRGMVNLDRPSVLWNFMMDRSYGRYLTVLDDDNEKLPTFVSRMSGILEEDKDLDLVTCGWRVDRPNGAHEGEYFLNLSTSPGRLAELSTCDGGAILYRRETFERAGYFSETLRTNEDWDWLRRAMTFARYKNLHEVHSTYRSHDDSRMKRCHLLGNDGDVQKVKDRVFFPQYGVRVVMPPQHRLTQSQRDVCSGIMRGIESIPWVTVNENDAHLVVSPFQMKLHEIEMAVKGARTILSMHMEDPYALGANLERVQRMNVVAETWVATNDAAAAPYYRKVVGDRVVVYPSLSADHALGGKANQAVPDKPARDIDVLICGYAYPSRKRFVRMLLPYLNGLRVTVVGDEWSNELKDDFDHIKVMPTQPIADTYRLHARARAVVCMHRVRGDCSDSVVDPVTLNRGYLEGICGPRVFMDRTRPYHGLDEYDVEWFDNPAELAHKLRTFLAGDSIGNAFTEKCASNYTYRTRLIRLINCLRAPRQLVEIP